ncbi:DUF6397 family protein [Streptomyces sp. WAC01280]|uniref:DUF6397 family protein n=1 Tax=Streptomyces sp. WAC01280 TaxID=2487424 RepID=UPI000F7899A1|nr:DUF6397 family protein [Streptomyces sp. WAC01280]RSS58586.1 hypothetical protein EF909_00985 [Streptomyces sp. WAC01280]
MTVDEGARTVTAGQAAEELELRRGEFRLAAQLGLVRTVPVGDGERRRVARAEIDRLRAAPDFPDGLRERVREVGTREAAALLSVPPDRFTRLVRTGHLSPVRFYLNRYRAVVWMYLAGEVTEFALARPALLTGRLPLDVRERLDAHEDARPRNWRARRLALLLRATDDPWARAAAIASMLHPVHVAEVVRDPYERAHLDRLRPPPQPGHPLSPAAREVTDRLALADAPDEVHWHRMGLTLALKEARADRPAPHPGEAAQVRAPLAPTGSEPPPDVAPDLDSVSAPSSGIPIVRGLEAPPPHGVEAPIERLAAARPEVGLPSRGGSPRTRLLDRLLRRKTAGATRGRRGKRPAAWP